MTQLLTARLTARQLVRYLAILGFDALATVCALYASMLLRLDGRIAPEFVRPLHVGAPILVCLRLLAVMVFQLHRWSFSRSGLSEAARLVAAQAMASVAFVVLFLHVSEQGYPRTVYPLEFFFSTSILAGFRFAPRLAESWLSDRRLKGVAPRTLIVGAGEAGDLLGRDLIRSSSARYWLIGYVDDDPHKLGAQLNGKRVLGPIADLPRLIARHQIDVVLLAITSLPAQRIREILDACAASKASFKIIPAAFSYLDEKITAAMLHDLSPEDLLPRDAIRFDAAEIRGLVHGRTALVTGAGGSIGGEICRQLASHGVAVLVMVDMNENELYLGQRRLTRDYPGVRIHAEVADIRDPARLARLAARYRPDDVFHAAAHKHVPLMEDAPEEAIKNNVFGTLHVAQMAHACGAERLVVISTDKAVRPTSVMGASKRIAELAVRDLARRSRTRMTAVRFGNVLGSAGSVVPIFKEQIARGGPVTVTHPECTRYFMTIPEAVGLVLLAGLGGYGELCVLDMGEPIKIAEMARNLITMAGLVPDVDIPVVYTGLRPGEKMYEELLTEDEEETRQVRNRILVASAPNPPRDLPERLRELRQLADAGDREGVLRAIEAVVPTYQRTGAQPLPLARPAHAASSAALDMALAPDAQEATPEFGLPLAEVVPLRGLRPRVS